MEIWKDANGEFSITGLTSTEAGAIAHGANVVRTLEEDPITGGRYLPQTQQAAEEVFMKLFAARDGE